MISITFVDSRHKLEVHIPVPGHVVTCALALG